MQAIMEPIFEIPYLIGVVILGILIIKMSKGNKAFVIFGAMAITLGCGDAFHLVPRMYALLTNGLENHVVALGFGKLVTSVTMTIFYVMLYHFWQLKYNVKRNNTLTLCIYALAITRISLCFFPQNLWFISDSSLAWGIYRNIPFAMLGGILIALFYKNKEVYYRFRFMWLAITLSFAFYIPVVLWADSIPLVGMLMLPKTCAYVWIVCMGYLDAKAS